MARQPNAGRDIESDILRVLARNETETAERPYRKPIREGSMTTREIREALPLPPVSATGVRSNLYVMTRRGLVEERGRTSQSSTYALTDEGRRVAETRGLVRGAEA